jgi:hypothetical protein
MQIRKTSRWSLMAAAAFAMGLLWPSAATAQTVAGYARAVQATTASSGSVTLADTGTLGGPTDAREASQQTGSVAALLSGETLHAATIGWDDQASSEASVSNVSVSAGGNTITAEFALARVIVGPRGNTRVRTSTVEGLTINGAAVNVSGQANQRITIPGGTLVINEQSGSVVNALHIVINGEADVVIASASASVQ